jgi:hypothetical protein
MIDPAFLSFSDAIAELLNIPGDIVDDEAGVRSYITECTIETPIELDVTRDDTGALLLGSAPPIYYVDTTYRPSYHHIRFTAIRTNARGEVPDGW